MDKTLDTVVLVHRLIIALALALFAVGLSVHRPNSAYDEAERDIQSLQKGIAAVSSQVEEVYKAIYDKSEFKASVLTWLKKHDSAQQDIQIQVNSPGDFAIPDSRQDSLVTLEAQVKWADRIYRDLPSPFFLCMVDRDHIFEALNKLFNGSATPKFQEIDLYIHEIQSSPGSIRQLRCEIELQYEVELGTLTGLRTMMLDVPTNVVSVTQVEPPGQKWVDMEIAGTLKANGLGDYEDEPGLAIFGLRELWPDLANRSPAAALAALKQKKEDEAEKAKEKIEILGASLSGSVTIILATMVEFGLMIYLLAHLLQIKTSLSGHETAVSDSPFFGIMRSSLGRQVILVTLFIMPTGVCLFALVSVFPVFKAEWLSSRWIVGAAFQFVLMGAVGTTGILLVRQAYIIKTMLRRAEGDGIAAGTGMEYLG
jgi:hypothetical protein